ncbi:MAG: OmpA family protein [Rhodobacteraceae bacterium]|nr:OmpA family protein [Paracoccaceae bacterium]
MPDGREYVLFDDTQRVAPVDLGQLPAARVDPQRPAAAGSGNDAALRRALQAELNADVGRRFSLDQIRSIAPVRYLAPEIEVDAITFATGSAAIAPDQARELADLGTALSRLLRRHPDTVLLIEGHTDAVGDASYNLALSDRRAESVALALSEYFDVPPENMVIQGYGEQLLKVPTQAAEPENRRAVVRNITALLN